MVKEGMKGVFALESPLSRIDGENGVLEYRGYSIHDLAEHSPYEEAVYLLWKGHLPSKKELEDFSQDLISKRRIPPEIIGLLTSLPDITHPMVVLRTAISYCGSLDNNLHKITPEENLRKGKEILAMMPTIIAYSYRLRNSKPLVHPRDDLKYAENFLWMMKGEEPDPLEVKALNRDLVLHAEHTLNASSYSARIAASTKSDFYAGIISATGTLMGPLHGGASQAVMEMLREVKESEASPEEWVKKRLDEGEIIPGFGHRVYETMDPRAEELKRIAKKLDKKKDNNWYSLSKKIEKTVIENKELYPNVDFYAATVYANIGIPDDFFIPIFAMGRIAGWSAQLMEQYEKNKLIRPLQKYVGETEKEYTPIDER